MSSPKTDTQRIYPFPKDKNPYIHPSMPALEAGVAGMEFENDSVCSYLRDWAAHYEKQGQQYESWGAKEVAEVNKQRAYAVNEVMYLLQMGYHHKEPVS